MEKANKKPNLLAGEKSPYLLQHAYNPVAWHPWGEAAFAKARSEDKMVLVSIGYATCHWCHVMERESFEDEETAAFLNKSFVAIKVDREERPDVDRQYMEALMAMGQSGGWPLNMFTTPDGRPVTGGTYFPPAAGFGRRSFPEVLSLLADAWQNDRDSILENATNLTDHLKKKHTHEDNPHPLSVEPINNTVEHFRRVYDETHGGFKLQPQNKFPPSMGLMLLLRVYKKTKEPDLLEMVENTLRLMVAGGIYDQLGGGLCRYSTDYAWMVPHFEKMLYDNALFIQVMTEASLATGKAIYQAYAEDVMGYVMRDMLTKEEAFCSAEDADSEGVEGLFYVWTTEEFRQLLSSKDAEVAQTYWGLKGEGNFEGGRSILYMAHPISTVAQGLGMTPEEVGKSLERARITLLSARSKRIRPLLDDKVLTSWNALMISAFAKAGRAFGDPRPVAVAEKAAEFLFSHLFDDSGRLLRRYREGEARFQGYLVDYAQLAVACLDLYEATYNEKWFVKAQELMADVNRLFFNPKGPYFDTGSDAEKLLTRSMDGFDGVEPSGNSACTSAFLKLHAYGLRDGHQAHADRIFSGFSRYLAQAGVSFSAMLSALDTRLSKPLEVVVVGNRAETETRAMLTLLAQHYSPGMVTAFAEPGDVERLGEIIPLLKGRTTLNGKPTAYVCRDMACSLPVTRVEKLAEQLLEV